MRPAADPRHRFAPGAKQREWLHESAWTFLGMLLSRGTALLLSVAAARLLVAEDFAIFAIAQNLQVALNVIAVFGFANAMAKYVGQEWSQDEASGARILMMIWGWASIAAAVMVLGLGLAARPLAELVFGHASAWWIVVLCAVGGLANAQVGTLSCAYAATVQMRRYSLLQARASLIVLPLLVAVLIPRTLTILLAGWSLSFLVIAFVLGWNLWTQTSLRPGRLGPSLLKLRVPGLGSFVAAAGVANILVYPMHAIVIGLIRSRHDSAEAAVYQICVLWMTLLTVLPGTLANNLVAAAARAVAGSGEGLALRRSALRVMGGLALLVGLLGVASSPLVAAGYGQVMTGKWVCLALISVAAAASTLTGGIWPSLMVVRGARVQLWLNAIFAGGYLVAAAILVPRYGARGAALACMVGAILQLVVAFESLRVRLPKQRTAQGG